MHRVAGSLASPEAVWRRHLASFLLVLALGCLPLTARTQSQSPAVDSIDSDGDGLSDALEQRLLERYAPWLMISATDCAVQPALFQTGNAIPTAVVEDGTVYGQAFPRKAHPGQVELHYFHLWTRDCGELGHRLDAEHVSALVEFHDDPDRSKALFWYAAAHEDTLCDAGHLMRAAPLGAEDRGATIWISGGKHASFLSEELCRHGCGGDRCTSMRPLLPARVVNLGEAGAPMHGIAWLASAEWPLLEKLTRTDFTDARLQRLARLPLADAAWATPSRRPAQAAILGVNAGLTGAATGALATGTALDTAHQETSTALDRAAHETGSALTRSSGNVWKALKKSAQKTGEVLDRKPKPEGTH